MDDLLRTLSRASEGIEIDRLRYNHLAFADNIILLCRNQNKAEILLKQGEKWAMENGIRFSPSKCVAISKSNLHLSIHNATIPSMNDSIYLGVPLNCDGLDWLAHVKKRAAQATKAAFFMQSKVYYFNGWTGNSNVAVYKSFIRPVMEYAIPDNISLKAFQKQQNMNLRIITGGDRCTSIGAMHRVVNVPPMDFRQKILKQAKIYGMKAVKSEETYYMRRKGAIRNLDDKELDVAAVTPIREDGRPLLSLVSPILKEIGKEKRRLLIRWRTGQLVRHQDECASCHDPPWRFSRQHAVDCSGVQELIKAKYPETNQLIVENGFNALDALLWIMESNAQKFVAYLNDVIVFLELFQSSCL